MNERTAPIETPQLLLEHHLKTLRLPTMLREYRGPRRTGLRRWGGSTIASHDSARSKTSTIPATCCAWRSWSCWTANDAPPNTASDRRSSRSPKAWTASTSFFSCVYTVQR